VSETGRLDRVMGKHLHIGPWTQKSPVFLLSVLQSKLAAMDTKEENSTKKRVDVTAPYPAMSMLWKVVRMEMKRMACPYGGWGLC
jgi:hypothetical protein